MKILQSIPYPTYTTAERDALVGVLVNYKINNSDTGLVEEWNGSAWVSGVASVESADVLLTTVPSGSTASNADEAFIELYGNKVDKITDPTVGRVWVSNADGNPQESISVNDINWSQYDQIGEIINEQFNDLTNWVNIGGLASFNVSGGQLLSSGGNNSILNYLRFDGYGKSSIETFTQTIKIIPPTATASTYGFGILIKSESSFYTDRLYCFKVSLLNDSSFGKISLITDAGTFETSLNGLPISTDQHLFKLIRTEGSLFASLTNLVTKKSSLLKVNTSSLYPFINEKPHAFKFSLVQFGGNNTFDDFVVECNDRQNADLLFVGDSITRGLTTNDISDRWCEIISQTTGKTISVNAAEGNLVEDINVNEIISYNAQKIVLFIGTNNIANNQSATLTVDKLESLINNLTGYTIGVNLFILNALPRNSYQTQIIAYNTELISRFPNIIDVFTIFNGHFESGNATYSIDGTHPNYDGANMLAAYLIGQLNISVNPKYIIKNRVLNYTEDRKLLITNKKLAGRRPRYLVDIIDESTNAQLGISSAPSGGMVLSSNAAGTGVVCAGCYYNGTSFIATHTSATVHFQYNDTIYINANSGLIVGNTFTPTLIGTINSTGQFIGGNGSPSARAHIGAGTASVAQMKLEVSVDKTSPANGDLWFDGTNLKMRIEGVTKTFTMT